MAFIHPVVRSRSSECQSRKAVRALHVTTLQSTCRDAGSWQEFITRKLDGWGPWLQGAAPHELTFDQCTIPQMAESVALAICSGALRNRESFVDTVLKRWIEMHGPVLGLSPFVALDWIELIVERLIQEDVFSFCEAVAV